MTTFWRTTRNVGPVFPPVEIKLSYIPKAFVDRGYNGRHETQEMIRRAMTRARTAGRMAGAAAWNGAVGRVILDVQ